MTKFDAESLTICTFGPIINLLSSSKANSSVLRKFVVSSFLARIALGYTNGPSGVVLCSCQNGEIIELVKKRIIAA